jgi:hypothetical protein
MQSNPIGVDLYNASLITENYRVGLTSTQTNPTAVPDYDVGS